MTLTDTPTVFTGRIWCPVQGRLSAVAIQDGRVVALGDDALALPDAEVREVDGLLLPAFGDGHAHPLFGGLEADGPDIRSQDSIKGIVSSVGEYAAAHPELEWILGASYDSSLAPHGLFDARWLDEAVADRPVMLRGWDYHTVWVNTRALELAGIDEHTPDPPLGEIPHRPDGSPIGTLREWGAVELVADLAGVPPLERRIQAIERASDAYAELGVTWVQDAWVEPPELEAYLAAARAGRLRIGYNLALYADPRRGAEQVERLVAMRQQVRDLGHPLLTAETVKFFADGVVENETAALLAPYCGGGHDHLGILVWPPDELTRTVTAVDAAGFQPHIHAIGDRAVRHALDAIEAADRENGPRDRRAVIAHLQLVDRDDLARLARLGVVGNAEPYWAQLDALMTELTVPRLGEERSAAQYPWATLIELGTRLSFGSDWPVSAAEPLLGIAVACSRQTADRVPDGGWTPAERLGVEVALAAYTAGVAYQGFRAAGTLEIGQVADLVELTTDPLATTAPRDIDTIRVRRTWCGGRLVYSTTKEPIE